MIGSLVRPKPRRASLIDRYVEYTENLPAPAIFRKWVAIHAISAVAKRQIWTRLGSNRLLYPNIYVFAVGPPGSGKSMSFGPMSALLRRSKACQLSPDDITKQGLLDALGDAEGSFIYKGKPYDYHCLALIASELASLMPQYDVALTGLLTKLYDGEDIYEERKRGHGKAVDINFPGLSFLIGTATQNLGQTIPHAMFNSGFMARIIMVYSEEEIIPEDMFADTGVADQVAETRLTQMLEKIGGFVGEMKWEPEARILCNALRQDQRAGAPSHTLLTHYNTRRWLHTTKLAMLAALARESMTVTAADWEEGRGWLTEAEIFMPDIFKDLISHADGQVHEELRMFLLSLQMMTKGRPVSARAAYAWLAQRVASYSIENIIEIGEKIGYLTRVGPNTGADAMYHIKEME